MRHFKINPVLKSEATFHGSQELRGRLLAYLVHARRMLARVTGYLVNV